MPIHTYLPQDRLRAIARGETLPERTTGAALFADISGFTALTEMLRRALGPRRGAEDLTRHLEAVYTALIAQVEKYAGSVIDFAGDAIICWFDPSAADGSSNVAIARAVACGFALQQAMRGFASINLPGDSRISLALKVTIASGPVRRFIIGNPDIYYLDTIAGATVTRTATAEHLAGQGDVLVDEATLQALAAALAVREWRTSPETQERFAVVDRFTYDLDSLVVDPETLDHTQAAHIKIDTTVLRRHLLPAVYEREVAGQASFLTEFRPCVALFVRFEGIDFDDQQAQSQLDAFIQQTQATVARYEGTLLQITIGDKGSYAYINFGALNTHEDDARRAVKTALELTEAAEELGFLQPLQIGLAQGTMRTGSFGGPTRRTYGALGDDVNLAARLMQLAAPGEILISGYVQKSIEGLFITEERPRLPIKGKAEPLSVFLVLAEHQPRAIRLQEPAFDLPMVGRETELQTISERLDRTLTSKSQLIAIVAEAGLGKSRLASEVIRMARHKGFTGYGGACQSDGVNTSYLVWKSIFSAFFDLDPAAPLHKQVDNLQREIEKYAPQHLKALPLLGKLLDLKIPDNEFTQTLEPKYRQSALHALLEVCLKAASKRDPLLLVLEDLHWMDVLSYDLLESLAKALAGSPVCFVMAYRPSQLGRLRAPRLQALPNFTLIELHELNHSECERLIRAKLAQLVPAQGGRLPSALVQKLVTRAQGNPFYLEELLNFLYYRGLDPRDPDVYQKIELPDSLHSLILSRIDQLSEQEKITLRVASIIGRLFRAAWLTGYYPELGDLPQVKEQLEKLNQMDITPLDSPEPELAYLFKHIVTHEVTYENLPFATRARLHEQLARYLESTYPEALPIEALAFHYGRSDNQAKQREYLLRAGEAAREAYANESALMYYTQLIPLLDGTSEQIEVQLQQGAVQELMGRFPDAEGAYQAALEAAKLRQEIASSARAQFALGKLSRLRGDYAASLDWLSQARQSWETSREAGLADTTTAESEGLGQVMTETGLVFWRQGDLGRAREYLREGLELARSAGDRRGMALALNNLGNMAGTQDDFSGAQELYQESLALRRAIGDKQGISATLSNLGNIAYFQGDYAAARALQEESLALKREIGDKLGIALTLNNLGNVALNQDDYTAAREMQQESLSLRREMGDKWGIAISLGNLGGLSLSQGEYQVAQALLEECLGLCAEIGDKRGMAYALLGLALAALAPGIATSPEIVREARQRLLESLHLRQAGKDQLGMASSLVGLSVLALRQGAVVQAAQLLGAVDAALKAIHGTMEVDVRSFYAQTQAAARAALGDSQFASAWEAGEQLSLEQAAQFALESTGNVD